MVKNTCSFSAVEPGNTNHPAVPADAAATRPEQLLKPPHFPGVLLVLANNHCWCQTVPPSAIILVDFTAGGLFFNAANKLLDQLEPVAVPAAPKISSRVTLIDLPAVPGEQALIYLLPAFPKARADPDTVMSFLSLNCSGPII